VNWLDVVIVVMVLAFVVWGLVKGVIVTLFGLAGLAVGIKLAWTYYPSLSTRLGFIQNAVAVKIAAFALILLGILIATWIVGVLVRRLITAVGLGWLDRLGGAVLGLALGIFFSVVLIAALLRVPLVDLTGTVFHSRLAVFLMERLAFFFSLLPGDFGQVSPVTAFFR